MSNPSFDNSRVLSGCRSHPAFAAWANLDRVRSSIVELLSHEQKCAKWYGAHHAISFLLLTCAIAHAVCVRVGAVGDVGDDDDDIHNDGVMF